MLTGTYQGADCGDQGYALRFLDWRRALANNMVVGTSTGWTKTLSLVGVGYRASVSGSKLILNLGYSHPIEMDFPKGVTVAVSLPVLSP